MRPMYDASTTKPEGNSRVKEKSNTSEYGVLILLSSPHVIANPPSESVDGGVSGKPPVGAGITKPAGTSWTPVNLGAVSGVSTPAGLESCVVNPNEPFLSKEFT